jgi:hypothetical protein
MIDFLYQITFFIALLVLDDRRIQANRIDYCTCFTVKNDPEKEPENVAEQLDSCDISREDNDNNNANRNHDDSKNEGKDDDDGKLRKPHAADRIMSWSADQILKRKVQLAAIMFFLFLLAGSISGATKLHQKFDFTELVPHDSYLQGFYKAAREYNQVGLYTYAFFRDVDQSDPEIQDKMEAYIEDLVSQGQAVRPVYFWLWDFRAYALEHPNRTAFEEKDFDDQVAEFLSVPTFNALYDEEIGRVGYNGPVKESRCE